MYSAPLPLAGRTSDLSGSIIDSCASLLARQQHDIVRFAVGAPSDDLLPVDMLDECYARPSAGKYGYGATEGEAALVEQILALSESAGTPTSADRILVTTGGMQGLDLAFRLFVDPGDLVIVEGPTYTNGSVTARGYGARLMQVPVDEDGMVVDALPDLVASAGQPPKVIYTVPTFQNPSGVTLTLERRRRLLELAEQWGAMIVDDDPYGMLRFTGEEVPGFLSIAPGHPLVFSVRTFSKIIAPGLRIGWVDADARLQPLLISARQAMDTCTSMPTQRLVTQFVASGQLAAHLSRTTGLFRERKDAMRAALERTFGADARVTDPEGGFFLWLTFTGRYAHADTEAMFEPAIREGVAFIPGPAFSIDGSFRQSLRLSYATSGPERIEEGVRRLQRAVDLVAAPV
ncbi:aminotransferase-like domain-containing protein [Sediminivirga luteola]|uniref:Aspartate aminotransferase n=1 Tax=Sediminivirga luteola TaxID=1774748 RepID=A0A8J2TUY4_9MICO|nr:PLP-dependent aminotransferase family protein [Sediminivirga luteola]GGA02483.1 aspartate aminotransferase [Sediminivirga luteola]